MEASRDQGQDYPAYRSLWVWLLLGWVVAYVDRTITGLVVFVAFRVITGLGEGTFYSNDRTVITQQTPFEKRGLGMGIAIAGLPIGLTIALIFTVPMIGLGESVLGAGNGWRMPFFISGAVTLVVGFGVVRFFRGQRGEHEFRPAFLPALRD